MISRIRKTGFKFFFATLFNRIVPQWLFRMRRYVVYEMDVQKLQAASQPSLEASVLEFSACQTSAEIEAVETLTWFSRELSTGDLRAFQATLDGQLAGGVWIASGVFDEDELGLRLMLNPQQAWLFAALVAEQARNKKVYSKLLPFVVAEVSQEFPRVLLAVNPDNRPSNSVHKKASRQTLGTVVAIRLLQFSVCWVSGQIRKDRTCSWQATKHPIELTLE